jgi:SAM-dependent methyltransferase
MGKYNSYDRIADLYDHYVTVDYDIGFWLSEAAGVDDVLEVTAGTGRVSLPLARAGIRVTAVDISFGLLTQLRGKAEAEGLRVETVHADMRDFDLKRTFPLVIVPFHSLEEIHDDCDVTAALRRVRAHIAPGGRAIVTLHNPATQVGGDAGFLRLMSDSELSNGNRLLFWHARVYDPSTREGHSYQLYEEYDVDGLLHRKRLFTPHFHLRDRAEIEALADRAALRVTRAWSGYGHEEWSGEGRYMIFEMQGMEE